MIFCFSKVFDWSNYFDISQPNPVTKEDDQHIEFNSAEPLNVYIFDSVFSGTTSTTNGGAVFYTSTVGGSNFLAESCYFTQCTSDKKGGALYAYAGSAGIFSKLCFTNCNAKSSSQYASLVLSQTNEGKRNEIYSFSCAGTQFLPSVSKRKLSVMQAFGNIVNKEHNISNTYIEKDAGIQCWPSSKASNTLLNFENLTSDWAINVLSDDDTKDFEMNLNLCNIIKCKPIKPVGSYDDYAMFRIEGSVSFINCCFVNNLDFLFFQALSKASGTGTPCSSTVSNCVVIGVRSYSDCWGASTGCSISFSGIKEEKITNTIICYRTADCDAEFDLTSEPKQEITFNQKKLSLLLYSFYFIIFLFC